MARLTPIAEALGHDDDAAAANRARVARLRTHKSNARNGRSYIVGEAPSTGRSQTMSEAQRRGLAYSTRGMNNS